MTMQTLLNDTKKLVELKRIEQLAQEAGVPAFEEWKTKQVNAPE